MTDKPMTAVSAKNAHTENKPITIGEFRHITALLPDDLPIYMVSPEGNLISDGFIAISREFINWHGDGVYLSARAWMRHPKLNDA